MSGVNIIDLIALLAIAMGVYFGWRSGFIIQVLALAGFVAGVGLVMLLAPFMADLLAEQETWLASIVSIAVVIGVVLLAQAVGSGLGVAVRRRLGRGILSGVDHGAGAAFGFVRGLFLVWLMAGLLAVLPMPALASEARQSVIMRGIQTRLPSPVVLAAELGRIFEATGLPDVFVGAPPPAELPEGGLAQQQADAIAALARDSTLRVEAIACGNFVSGTAFAVNADHLVTNAHVVAGADQVWVSFDGAFERHDARVVLIDTQLDVALLDVNDRLRLVPLELATERPARGAPAAAIGFTGGGGERVIPAVVSRSIEALGRDIYGEQIVARQVIEMRADVRPGDSGGPLVLDDGTVGGVTFSESRTNPDIGYALDPRQVRAAIAPALQSETPVDTGACISD